MPLPHTTQHNLTAVKLFIILKKFQGLQQQLKFKAMCANIFANVQLEFKLLLVITQMEETKHWRLCYGASRCTSANSLIVLGICLLPLYGGLTGFVCNLSRLPSILPHDRCILGQQVITNLQYQAYSFSKATFL